MSWGKSLIAATLLGAACMSSTALAQEKAKKSLIVARVENAEMEATLADLLPAPPDGFWHGEVYRLKLEVIDVLAGKDPGKHVTVKVTAHARRFKDMTIVVMIDPELKMFVPGQSWWTSIRNLICLPADMLKGEDLEAFADGSFEFANERCLDY